jgi:hypothetical protein
MRSKKRIALLFVAAGGTLGVVAASAASLGGITTPSLGAENSAVTACDTDGVTIAFAPAYDNAVATGYYTAGAVTVSGMNAACTGKKMEIRLKNTASGADTIAASTIAGGVAVTGVSQAFTVTAPSPIDASVVNGISLTIHD